MSLLLDAICYLLPYSTCLFRWLFQVYFEVSVAPLGTAIYHVKSVHSSLSRCHLAQVHIYSAQHSHGLRYGLLFDIVVKYLDVDNVNQGGAVSPAGG